MNYLLTAATQMEIMPAIEWLKKNWQQENGLIFTHASHRLQIIISGAGAVLTAYHLTKYFAQNNCDFAVQAGISGSFKKELAIGETVIVQKDGFGDWGAQDGENFTDIFTLGLAQPNEFPFTEKMLNAPAEIFPALNLQHVNGITVSTVSGKQSAIDHLVNYYHPDIETMEGAAFHYVCLQEKISFLQLRSIANYVEVRDKNKWNIPLAIKNLNSILIEYFLNKMWQ